MADRFWIAYKRLPDDTQSLFKEIKKRRASYQSTEGKLSAIF